MAGWQERAQELIDRFRLGDLADRDGRLMSGGQMRRASLAIGIALNPPILLLDEPTANLDIATRREIVRTIADLRGVTDTVVIATHDMQLVCQFADRVIVLNQGEVIGDGTPEEIFHNEAVVEASGICRPRSMPWAPRSMRGQPASISRTSSCASTATAIWRLLPSAGKSGASNKGLPPHVTWKGDASLMLEKLSENVMDKVSIDFLRNQVLRNAYGNDDTPIAKLDPRVLIVWYLFFGLVPWFLSDVTVLLGLFLFCAVTTRLARVAPLVLFVFALGVFSQTGYLFIVALFFGGSVETLVPLLVLTLKVTTCSLASITVFSGLDPDRLSNGLLWFGCRSASRSPSRLPTGFSPSCSRSCRTSCSLSAFAARRRRTKRSWARFAGSSIR